MKYSILISEIAKRGIKKNEIAKTLGISYRSLYNKLYGVTPFSWQEVCLIKDVFFPDLSKDELFKFEKY